jgi:hypothetical protein
MEQSYNLGEGEPMKLKHMLFAAALLGAFYGGTLVPTVHSQSDEARYAQMGFMKVEPGGVQEYLEVEQNLWKPVHQELVKTGKKESWWLFRVRYPRGTDHEYNFITVNAFQDLQDLETAGYQEILSKVHAGKNTQDILDRTLNARKQVNVELWELIEQVQ